MKSALASFCFIFFCFISQAQSVTGKWVTIDDETGKKKSIVEIYSKGGMLYGKVIKLFREPSQEQDPVCIECTDDRKNQRILGMEIIRSLRPDGDEWEEGTICDPKTGKVYDCSLWIDEDDSNKLEVRGYWGIFFRTQIWLRYTE